MICCFSVAVILDELSEELNSEEQVLRQLRDPQSTGQTGSFVSRQDEKQKALAQHCKSVRAAHMTQIWGQLKGDWLFSAGASRSVQSGP